MTSAPPAGAKARSGRAGRRPRRRLLHRLVAAACLVAGLVILALLGASVWLHRQLVRSLPPLEGRWAVQDLRAPVTVKRDALGVPTLQGANRLDVAAATGFVHAQDRFFQMDLARRQAAGELAELFGPVALEEDLRNRLHRFRPLAKRVLLRLPAQQRALLDAYSAGVNGGLASLLSKPFEYVLLRAEPSPWSPEDSVLVILSMFLSLQGNQWRTEATLGLMHEFLPPPLFAFLAPGGTEWDAPLIGAPLVAPPVPAPTVIDLRSQPRRLPRAAQAARPDARQDLDGEETGAVAASNSWAVAASLTRGGALVANDMHLGLAVPTFWYRAVFGWQAGTGSPVRVAGITLPGVPLMVVGSNGRVAWSFTNSMADASDLVVVEPDPLRPDHYLTSSGPRAFERRQEVVEVQGEEPRRLQIELTLWGPVVDEDHHGRKRALAWVPYHETAVNLGLLDLEAAADVGAALAIAKRAGIPAQNFVVADRGGHIGWTIAGALPRRAGFDGRFPSSWRDSGRGWRGWLAAAEVPQIVDPESGRLWTANNRVVGQGMGTLGDSGYVLGARAHQIRDRLFALDRATAKDMLAIQLDDEALFLARWRELLLRTLTPAAMREDPRRREVRRYVESWGGHAAVDSVGYALVRGFRLALGRQVFEHLTAACKRADPDFSYQRDVAQYEGPLWRLVSERPVHLLDPEYADWDHQLLAAVDAARERLLVEGGDLQDQTWGRFNQTRVQHPFSRGLPLLGRFLDMPAQPLPGDSNMPRFQLPSFGASERMVVSPGREEEGIFHMPCGQSGHPLSTHYRDSHAAWVEGRATPFLPGPPVSSLTLVPEGPK